MRATIRLMYCGISSLLLILIAVNASNHNDHHPSTKTNLLFIMFDDLRPELGCYGKKDMITPNFERLAARSVVFDLALCQIAVCNPSRDSLLTGLRPDTTGTYGFQSSFRPHMVLPAVLGQFGYKTASYGKIFHWETDDRAIWNYDHWDNGWYEYQEYETRHMNSSTMPDRVKREEDFRDYEFTSKAIETLRKLESSNDYYMVALGFKLPHLAVHVPYKYFDMYRDRTHMWRRHARELRYPISAPVVGHKCCAIPTFSYMQDEGAERSSRVVDIATSVDFQFPQDMYTELMWGYAAAVTFLDAQLGRVLDVLDELDMWHNTTIVLTSDHGMHNGEKGMWEKWTVFEESTRVPLFISHPQSPFQNRHYPHPVELIDIFPTLVDLLEIPEKRPCKHMGDMNICRPLQGKSLCDVILGGHHKHHLRETPQVEMPQLSRDFAISQSWRCAKKDAIIRLAEQPDNHHVRNPWFECNKVEKNIDSEISVMGYSMRTVDYRYTVWFHFDRINAVPFFDVAPFAEELYDHRDESLGNFTHRELQNLILRPEFSGVIEALRSKLLHYLRKEVVYRGPFTGR